MVRNRITITIYGQDYTDIEKAYIGVSVDDSNKITPLCFDDDELGAFLVAANQLAKPNSKKELKNIKKTIAEAWKVVKPEIVNNWHSSFSLNELSVLSSALNCVCDSIASCKDDAKKKNERIEKLYESISELKRILEEFKETKNLSKIQTINEIINQLTDLGINGTDIGRDVCNNLNNDICILGRPLFFCDHNIEILSMLINAIEFKIEDIKEKEDDILKKAAEIDQEQFEKFDELNKSLKDAYGSLSKFILSFLDEMDAYTDSKTANKDELILVGHSFDTEEGKYQFHNRCEGRDQFGNIVGTISKSSDVITEKQKETIKILTGAGIQKNKPVTVKANIFSRFDDLERIIYENKQPFFLASLLRRGEHIVSNVNYDSSYSFDFLFDFYLIQLIKKTIKDALSKGYFRKYQRFETNTDRIRGSIDIARHIKLNAGMDNGRIACTYRENSTDNMINHLLLTALDYLDKKNPNIIINNIDDTIRQKLHALRFEIRYPKYNRSLLISKNNIPISHPYYHEYSDLQKYCLMILREEGISPFSNENDSVEGILYYINDLWEDFLKEFISKAINDLNNNKETEELELYSQKEISKMTPFNETKVYGINESETGLINRSRPDFVVGFDTIGFYILDAKYRPQWLESLNGKLDNNALGDDYDKCIRDMVSIDARAAGVMFPAAENQYNKVFENNTKIPAVAHRFSRFNRNGVFYTFPVPIPDTKESDNLYEWENKLSEKISPILDCFANSLCYEYEKSKIFMKNIEETNNECKKLSGKYDFAIGSTLSDTQPV